MKKISLKEFKKNQISTESLSKLKGGSGGCCSDTTFTYGGTTSSSGQDHDTSHADRD